MTVDYAAKAAKARKLITKFGTTVQVERTTTTGGSPSTGGGAKTLIPYDFAGVVLPVEGKALDTPNTLAKAGDFTAYLEAGPISPTTTDRLICPQGNLAIIEAVELAPAGVPVMWTITARKGA